MTFTKTTTLLLNKIRFRPLPVTLLAQPTKPKSRPFASGLASLSCDTQIWPRGTEIQSHNKMAWTSAPTILRHLRVLKWCGLLSERAAAAKPSEPKSRPLAFRPSGARVKHSMSAWQLAKPSEPKSRPLAFRRAFLSLLPNWQFQAILDS